MERHPSRRSRRSRHSRHSVLLAAGAALALASAPTLTGGRPGAAGAADGEPGIAAGATATAGATRVVASGLMAFPIEPTPRCEILDNFGDARSGGRSHEGVDILADLGQAVYAVVAGTLIGQFTVDGPNSSLSGNAWRLQTTTKDLFVYAHLSAFAPGLAVGSTVQAGQLIGYVGDTGNPGAGNYHLHLEYHPGGGAAVDLLPLLTPVPPPCRIY